MDTICAIATPAGNGAISIIRISGQESIKIVNKIFRGCNLEKVSSHTIHYGHIVDDNEVIDEVLISVMKAPKTFTREDVVEINCHGGSYVTERVLKLLLENGAVLAGRGEFTKRAFLNGRIDLTKAEAVMDMITADSNSSLRLANNGLSGRLKKCIDEFREDILELIANIEVNIDYPEYDDAIVITNKILIPKLEELIKKMESLLKTASTGKLLKDGILTAIVGRPNVGKSSLLNLLLDEDKAIVTDVEGTTRDIVEGSINLSGITLKLIDTAGIRKTDNYIEALGIDKAKSVIEKADLVILVLDSSQKLTQNDLDLLELTKNKQRIIVMNKIDLEKKAFINEEVISISAKNGMGLSLLEDKIVHLLKLNENKKDETILSNIRHIVKLEEARNSLNMALSSCLEGQDVDLVEIDIKDAWSALGEITGDTSSESLINELFSKFCLGK